MTPFHRQRRALLLALHLLYIGALALPLPAAAMQILDAADHAEIAAEISVTGVNRIALAGDRIAKVVRMPDGFAVEHDAGSGDLYLRPAIPQPGTQPAEAAPDREPVTLFIGTERGFTYRLTLIPAERESAQILIRNGDAAEVAALPAAEPAGGPHVAALVRLVRAVSRREPLPGYAIHAGSGGGFSGLTLIETWRGPRFRALVLEADRSRFAGTGGGAGFAGTIGERLGAGRVVALWLAAPGTGPSGGRLAVAVVEPAVSGAPR